MKTFCCHGKSLLFSMSTWNYLKDTCNTLKVGGKHAKNSRTVLKAQVNLTSSLWSCWNHLDEINWSMLNLSLALYLLTRDERIVLVVEGCLLTHIQLKKLAFPWGLKAFQSFYFSNLYPMYFPLYDVVCPRSGSELGKKPFLQSLQPRLERRMA